MVESQGPWAEAPSPLTLRVCRGGKYHPSFLKGGVSDSVRFIFEPLYHLLTHWGFDTWGPNPNRNSDLGFWGS